MPFSLCYGLILTCLTMAPLLAAQACVQPRTLGQAIPRCCVAASNASISQAVTSCFEQKENTFSYCKIHAYIFRTRENDFCTDPRAYWISRRLERLQAKGICCKVL